MHAPDYTLLDLHQHQAWRLQDDPAFSHTAQTQLVAVAFTEIVSLASCMPLVIVGEPDAGQTLTAMLSLRENDNAFSQSQWQGHVVPLSIQTYPFNFALEDNKLLTLIDEACTRWQEEGQPLFSSDGTPTPFLKQRQSQLAQLANGLHLADQFTAFLSQNKLLSPLQVTVTQEEGSENTIKGIYTINEAALNALPADTLHQLQQNGMLIAIHAMMVSLRQFNRLVQLARQQGEAVTKITLSQ